MSSLASAPALRRWWLTASACLILATALRLGVLALVLPDSERAISPDSELYIRLGQEFEQAYLQNEPRLRSASIWRTPGYPLLCAVGRLRPDNPVIPILMLQGAISVAIVVVVIRFGRMIAGANVGLLAGVLVAIDPLTLTYGGYVRNEIPFTLLLLLGTSAWYQSLRKNRFADSAAAGGFLGLSLLVRPVTTYIPLILLPISLMMLPCRWRCRVLHATLFLAAFLIPVGGLVWRNHQVTGFALISSIEGTNLLYYRAAGAIAEETGGSRRAIELKMKEEVDAQYPLGSNPSERNHYEKRLGVELLLKHPGGAALSSLKGLGRLLFGPGYSATAQLIWGDANLSSTATAAVFAFQGMFLAVLLLASIIGAFVIRKENRAGFAALAAIVVYFCVICAAPEAYSRFRAPLMPLLCIFAAAGLVSIANGLRSYGRTKNSYTSHCNKNESRTEVIIK